MTGTEMKVRCAHTKLVELTALVPHPLNPNEHTDQQIDMLAGIMRFQGVRNAITISKRSGFITKGHGRLLAAKLNGWTHFPVDEQEYENEAMEYADLVADNAIAELSTLNITKIRQEIQKLPDLDLKVFGLPALFLMPIGAEVDGLEERLPVGSGEYVGCEVNYLIFSDHKLQITDDELELLVNRLKKHVDEVGTNFGFVKAICS